MSVTNVVKNVLIVTAHPVANSLSHSLAARIAERLREQGTQVEIADLHEEAFSRRCYAPILMYITGMLTRFP